MKKQFCSYCGTKLDEGARFCKNCGEPVAQTQRIVNGVSFQESPETKTQPPKNEQVKEDLRAKHKPYMMGNYINAPIVVSY